MDIIVPVRMVPDPVEELDPNPDGTDIDRAWIEFVLNEFDDHAIEEALLTKEASDGDVNVTVVGLDTGNGDVDQALYIASAKGADDLVKITDASEGTSTSEAASLFASYLEDRDFDAVFTGVQSAEDRDGQLTGRLASQLDVPHVSVVTAVDAGDGSAVVEKEFSGGVTADYEVDLPAAIGIQAAQEPPRYVPVSQMRGAMKSADIEEVPAGDLDAGDGPGSTVVGLHEPETGEGAEMISGMPDDAVEQLLEVLADNGVEV